MNTYMTIAGIAIMWLAVAVVVAGNSAEFHWISSLRLDGAAKACAAHGGVDSVRGDGKYVRCADKQQEKL